MKKLNIKAISLGIITYILLYVLLTIALTILYNFAQLSTSSIFALSAVLVISACFASGFIAGRQAKINGPLHGLTVGGAGAVLIIAIMLILATTLGIRGSISSSFPVMLMLVLQSCIISSIGGMLGQSRSDS